MAYAVTRQLFSDRGFASVPALANVAALLNAILGA